MIYSRKRLIQTKKELVLMGYKKNLKESLIHNLYEADRLFHSDQNITGLSTPQKCHRCDSPNRFNR